MGEANLLTPGEQQTVRAFLSAARLLSERLGQELLRETGMRQIHYEILAWLSEAPQGRLRMAELARRTAVSHSRLSHLVDRLEERRWVERRDCSDDARGLLASLTDDGAKALQEAAPWHAECVHSRLLEQLTPEQTAHLREISEVLLENLTGHFPRRGMPTDQPAARQAAASV
ncbi:DNA-binding MarR family transcriptional regulator [Streptomyces atratus]|uniref:MarR family winged helix-turn-helix transcriptional regulator n=1 Tax=Streptomyces atratus TaxID=1893 RepID=UPI00339703D1